MQNGSPTEGQAREYTLEFQGNRTEWFSLCHLNTPLSCTKMSDLFDLGPGRSRCVWYLHPGCDAGLVILTGSQQEGSPTVWWVHERDMPNGVQRASGGRILARDLPGQWFVKKPVELFTK